MNINEINIQSENPLEFTKEQINGLESTTLLRVLPLYEKQYKEVIKQLEQILNNETKKQQQKLNGLEVKKFELETSAAKFKKIDMELTARESKVLRELKKVKVMCPIYQYKMSCLLEKFNSEDTLKDYSPPLQWAQKLNNLLEQKQNLQETIEINEKIIKEFIEKYIL